MENQVNILTSMINLILQIQTEITNLFSLRINHPQNCHQLNSNHKFNKKLKKRTKRKDTR